MKKTITLLLTLVLIMSLGASPAFAVSPHHYRNNCNTLRTCVRNDHKHIVSLCAINADSDDICTTCGIRHCSTVLSNTDACTTRSTHHSSTQRGHHSRGHHGRH